MSSTPEPTEESGPRLLMLTGPDHTRAAFAIIKAIEEDDPAAAYEVVCTYPGETIHVLLAAMAGIARAYAHQLADLQQVKLERLLYETSKRFGAHMN